MLKVEKRVGNTVTPVAIGYTVESNIQPKVGVLQKLVKLMQHGKFLPCSTNNSIGDNALLSTIVGKIEPFAIGSIVLSKGNHSVGESYTGEFGEDSKLVAYADTSVPYAGSISTAGTINETESTDKFVGNQRKYHFVYDFPTHAGNNTEINEIIFTTNYQVRAKAGIVGSIGSNVNTPQGITPVFSRMKEPLLPLWDGLASIKEQTGIPGQHSTNFWVNQHGDIFMGKTYAKIGGNAGKVVISGATIPNDYHNPRYFNGKWVFCRTNHMFNGEYKMYEVQNITFNNGVHEVAVVEKIVDFRKTVDGFNLNQNIGVMGVIPWGDRLFLFIAPWGGSADRKLMYIDSSYQVGRVVDMSSLKSHEYLMTSFNEPTTMYYEESSDTTLISMGGTYGVRFNRDLTQIKKSQGIGAAYDYSVQLSRIAPDVKKAHGLWSPYQDSVITTGSTFIAEVEQGNWVLKFKLDTPIYKLPDEVLKLTFDITIEM